MIRLLIESWIMSKYDVVDFEEVIALRLKKEDKKVIKKIVRQSKDLYDSPSHFIRCAVRRLIREEERRLKI